MTTLLIRMGHAPGTSFRVKHHVELTDKRRIGGNIIEGRLDGWTRVAIISSVGERARFFEIAPDESAEETVIGLHETFAVRGRYRVLRKINNAREAREAWKAFTPA